MKKAILLGSVVGLLAMQTAHADVKFYVLGGAGSVKQTIEVSGTTNAGLQSQSFRVKNSFTESGSILGVGALLGKNVAIELNRANFGDSSGKTGGQELTGIGVGFVNFIEIGWGFDLVLRGDVYRMTYSSPAIKEDNGYGIGAGVGARYTHSSGLFGQAQYQYLFMEDNLNGFVRGKNDVGLSFPSLMGGYIF